MGVPRTTRDKAKELKVNIIDVELALCIIEDILKK